MIGSSAESWYQRASSSGGVAPPSKPPVSHATNGAPASAQRSTVAGVSWNAFQLTEMSPVQMTLATRRPSPGVNARLSVKSRLAGSCAASAKPCASCHAS